MIFHWLTSVRPQERLLFRYVHRWKNFSAGAARSVIIPYFRMETNCGDVMSNDCRRCKYPEKPVFAWSLDASLVVAFSQAAVVAAPALAAAPDVGQTDEEFIEFVIYFAITAGAYLFAAPVCDKMHIVCFISFL